MIRATSAEFQKKFGLWNKTACDGETVIITLHRKDHLVLMCHRVWQDLKNDADAFHALSKTMAANQKMTSDEATHHDELPTLCVPDVCIEGPLYNDVADAEPEAIIALPQPAVIARRFSFAPLSGIDDMIENGFEFPDEDPVFDQIE